MSSLGTDDVIPAAGGAEQTGRADKARAADRPHPPFEGAAGASLPAPVAWLIRRALDSRSAGGRHHLGMLAADSMLKLATAARVGAYLQRCAEPEGTMANALQRLLLPEPEDWPLLLDMLATHLVTRRGDTLLPLAEFDTSLRMRRAEWRGVEAFVDAAADQLTLTDEEIDQAIEGGTLGFLAALTRHRARVVERGLEIELPAHERLGELLLGALGEVLPNPGLLGGLELALARTPPDGSSFGWLVLHGSEPRSRPGWEAHGRELAAADPPTSGRLYMLGPGVRIALHPLVAWGDDQLGRQRVAILDRSLSHRRRPDDPPWPEPTLAYLDCTSGEPLSSLDPTLAAAELAVRLGCGDRSPAGAGAVVPPGISPGGDQGSGSTDERRGDYVLGEVLGHGSCGAVRKARNADTGVLVAVKDLPEVVSGDPMLAPLWQRELAAFARCSHPGLLTVLTRGCEEGRHWYAVELVEGIDLESVGRLLGAWRRNGLELGPEHLSTAVASLCTAERGRDGEASVEPTAPATGPRQSQADRRSRSVGYYRRLARLMAGACEAVHHLHRHGVVHRDLRTANLMLTRDGCRLVVAEPGLGALAAPGPGLGIDPPGLPGSLRAIAPEQLQRGPLDVDQRADVYGLGAALYELACFGPLHAGLDGRKLIEAKLQREQAAPRKLNPSLPRDLAAVVEGAIGRRPEARYPSVRALGEDLEAFAGGHPVSVRWRWPWRRPRTPGAALASRVALGLAMLAIAGLAGLAGWHLLEWRQDRTERARASSEAAAGGAASRVAVGLLELGVATVVDPPPPEAVEGLLAELAQAETALAEQPILLEGLIQQVCRFGDPSTQPAILSPLFAHALTFAEQRGAAEPGELLPCLVRLAATQRAAGELGASAELCERALALAQDGPARGDSEAVECLESTAEAFRAREQARESIQLLTVALDARERRDGQGDPASLSARQRLADAVVIMALSQRGSGDAAAAIASAERALEISATIPGDRADDAVLATRAKALLIAARADEARVVLQALIERGWPDSDLLALAGEQGLEILKMTEEPAADGAAEPPLQEEPEAEASEG